MLTKNTLVRFARRVNDIYPFRVEDTKLVNNIREVKVKGLWWPETCFITNKEWEKRK